MVHIEVTEESIYIYSINRKDPKERAFIEESIKAWLDLRKKEE